MLPRRARASRGSTQRLRGVWSRMRMRLGSMRPIHPRFAAWSAVSLPRTASLALGARPVPRATTRSIVRQRPHQADCRVESRLLRGDQRPIRRVRGRIRRARTPQPESVRWPRPNSCAESGAERRRRRVRDWPSRVVHGGPLLRRSRWPGRNSHDAAGLRRRDPGRDREEQDHPQASAFTAAHRRASQCSLRLDPVLDGSRR